MDKKKKELSKEVNYQLGILTKYDRKYDMPHFDLNWTFLNEDDLTESLKRIKDRIKYLKK